MALILRHEPRGGQGRGAAKGEVSVECSLDVNQFVLWFNSI
jgi:hypothetical protein